MHPDITSDKPGRCTKCGMELVLKGNKSEMTNADAAKSYKPLFIIVGLIFIASLAASYPNFNINFIIKAFMAGFFIVFAGFKLVDIKGFAAGYSTYDLLAKRFFLYGYIYPFIEIFFGLAMIIGLYDKQILAIEVIVMVFSGIGVLIKLLRHEKFQCVCLGTFLKVPLTYVTLVEDFGMALLALLLLFL